MKRHIYSYAQLDAVAKRHYDGETNCCSVIATAAAARVSFGKAFSIQMKLGKTRNRGIGWNEIFVGLKKLGFEAERLSREESIDLFGKTLLSAKRHGKNYSGTWLISTVSHITCIREGEMVDWAADRNSRKRVEFAMKVTMADVKTIEEVSKAVDHRSDPVANDLAKRCRMAAELVKQRREDEKMLQKHRDQVMAMMANIKLRPR